MFEDWTVEAVGPVCVYKYQDGTYTVSENRVWVEGVYDSREAALAAVGHDVDDLARIWNAKKPDGLISMADLLGR
jgi:hypothetical protein